MRREAKRAAIMACTAIFVAATTFFAWERPPAESVTPEAIGKKLSGPQKVLVGGQQHETGGEIVQGKVRSEGGAYRYFECNKGPELVAALGVEEWEKLGQGKDQYVNQQPEAAFYLAELYELRFYENDHAVLFNGYEESLWKTNISYYCAAPGTCSRVKAYMMQNGRQIQYAERWDSSF